MSADRFGPSRCRVAPVLGTMASADFPGHFLPGISPDKSVLLPGTTAAFTSASEPLGFAVLCHLATSRRPSMRFLSVGPPVSHSLPPHGRLPFRSWLLVVVSHVSMSGSPTGDLHPIYNTPMLGVHILEQTRTRPRAVQEERWSGYEMRRLLIMVMIVSAWFPGQAIAEVEESEEGTKIRPGHRIMIYVFVSDYLTGSMEYVGASGWVNPPFLAACRP